MRGLPVSSTVLVTTLLLPSATFASGGDRWTLSLDMQVVSNPSPPIDPGAPGGGAATWTYLHGDGPYTTSTTNVVANVNPEVPDAGLGWVKPDANHISLLRFSVDANPVAPFGTGNDKTVYKMGDLGGHGTTGARWITDHAGEFLVEWLGYNGRNQLTDAGQHAGRLTFLRMTGPDGVDLDVQPIVGGVQDGSANAYTNSATLNLLAGDSLTLLNEGGEWVGLDLRIRELPLPPRRPGDFDDDGDVDGADFLVWQRNFGVASGATQAQGDADLDADVDGADLAIWTTDYGTTATSSIGAVPEPATESLLCLAGFGWAAVRRAKYLPA